MDNILDAPYQGTDRYQYKGCDLEDMDVIGGRLWEEMVHTPNSEFHQSQKLSHLLD